MRRFLTNSVEIIVTVLIAVSVYFIVTELKGKCEECKRSRPAASQSLTVSTLKPDSYYIGLTKKLVDESVFSEKSSSGPIMYFHPTDGSTTANPVVNSIGNVSFGIGL